MSNNVTTINARGFVVADFDTATFSLSFNEFAPKSRDAKIRLKKGVAKITSTIENLKKKGMIVLATNYRSNITVGPHSVYDRVTGLSKVESQKAIYSITFQTTTLEIVSEAYDALSELDVNELSVYSPIFSLRAESAFKQQALEDAWKVAQVLFTNQCVVLGLDPKNYSVNSWVVNYGGQNYNSMAKGRNVSNSALGGASYDGNGDDAIELNSGRALVDVVLVVDYVKSGS